MLCNTKKKKKKKKKKQEQKQKKKRATTQTILQRKKDLGTGFLKIIWLPWIYRAYNYSRSSLNLYYQSRQNKSGRFIKWFTYLYGFFLTLNGPSRYLRYKVECKYAKHTREREVVFCCGKRATMTVVLKILTNQITATFLQRTACFP